MSFSKVAAVVAGSVALFASGERARAAEGLDFNRGDVTLQLTTSYIYGESGFSEVRETTQGSTFNFGAGYYLLDGLGVYGEAFVAGFDAEDSDNQVFGAGANLLLRWHFLRRDNWSLFVDGGVGYVRFDSSFPTGGTHSNITPRVGLGATWEFAPNMHLVGGLRYYHISNAYRHGEDQNPGFDSAEAYVGLVWKL